MIHFISPTDSIQDNVYTAKECVDIVRELINGERRKLEILGKKDFQFKKIEKGLNFPIKMDTIYTIDSLINAIMHDIGFDSLWFTEPSLGSIHFHAGGLVYFKEKIRLKGSLESKIYTFNPSKTDTLNISPKYDYVKYKRILRGWLRVNIISKGSIDDMSISETIVTELICGAENMSTYTKRMKKERKELISFTGEEINTDFNDKEYRSYNRGNCLCQKTIQLDPETMKSDPDSIGREVISFINSTSQYKLENVAIYNNNVIIFYTI